MNKQDLIYANMTPTQRRRWKLYLKGHKLIEIAAAEGVSHQMISKSLKGGLQRARRRLSNYNKLDGGIIFRNK